MLLLDKNDKLFFSNNWKNQKFIEAVFNEALINSKNSYFLEAGIQVGRFFKEMFQA